MTNLAQKHENSQGEVIAFPKQERQVMSDKDEGYTRLPNLLIDGEIMADLSDKAFKCLLFIVRQTMGFGRNSHTIAITQFQKYCGIKKEETVTRSIRELEQCNVIKVVRKKGCMSEYFLTLNHYRQKGVPSSNGSTPIKQGETTPIEQGYTTPIKGGSIKETFKENIKEIHTQENAPEKNDFDEQWNPNLGFLKTILAQTKFSQRADEILSMSDFQFHLGNFNAHWENKTYLTENQKTRKFASWLIQEFEKAERSVKVKTHTSGKPSRNVNDAWDSIPQFQGEVTPVEIPEDFV